MSRVTRWLTSVMTLPLSIACTTAEQGKHFDLSLFLPPGSVKDRSFTDSVRKGVLGAGAVLDFSSEEYRPCTDADVASVLETELQQKSKDRKLTITVGFQYQTVLEEASTCDLLGDSILVHIDQQLNTDCKHMLSVSYDTSKDAFVAGWLSAVQSETKRLAILVALRTPIPALRELADNFRCGAEQAGGVVEGEYYLDDYVSADQVFSAPECAGHLANLISARYSDQQRIDVVYPVAGASSLGVIEAAKNCGDQRYTFGGSGDQSFRGSQVVLGSVVKQLSSTTDDMLTLMASGKDPKNWFAGDRQLFGNVEILLNSTFEHLRPEIATAEAAWEKLNATGDTCPAFDTATAPPAPSTWSCAGLDGSTTAIAVLDGGVDGGVDAGAGNADASITDTVVIELPEPVDCKTAQ